MANAMREFAADLEDASEKVTELASLATRKAGYDIIADYMRTARVDTGNMINSAADPDITNDGLHIEVGPTAEYAIFQEEGTSDGISGDHALRNATNKHVPKWQQAMEQIGGELL